MRSCVFRNSMWRKIQFVSALRGPAAEVDIFEPERKKTFVKAAQFLPHFAPKHQKRPRGLLYGRTDGIVHPQTPIVSIHWIVRPEPIQQYRFQNERDGCRKSPDHKSNLGMAIWIEEAATGARGMRQAAGV